MNNSQVAAIIQVSLIILLSASTLMTALSPAQGDEYPEKQPDKTYSPHFTVQDIDMTGDGEHLAVIGSKLIWYSQNSDSPVWESGLGGKHVIISGDGNFTLTSGVDDMKQTFVALYDNHGDNAGENAPVYINYTAGEVSSIDISDNGNYFVAGDEAGFIYLYNEHGFVWSFNAGDSITKVAISGDGRYIAAGTDWHECMLYLFSRESNIPLWNYHAISGISILDMTYNGSYIMTNIDAGRVALFSNANNTPLWDYLTDGDLKDGIITPDGDYIAAGGGHKMVYLLSHNGQTVAQYVTNYSMWHLAMTPNGKYVAAADGGFEKNGDNPTLNVGNYFFSDSIQWKFYLNNTDDEGAVAISDDGRYVISSHKDKVYLFVTEGLNNDDKSEDQHPDGGLLSGPQYLYISAGALVVIGVVLFVRWKWKRTK